MSDAAGSRRRGPDHSEPDRPDNPPRYSAGNPTAAAAASAGDGPGAASVSSSGASTASISGPGTGTSGRPSSGRPSSGSAGSGSAGAGTSSIKPSGTSNSRPDADGTKADRTRAAGAHAAEHKVTKKVAKPAAATSDGARRPGVAARSRSKSPAASGGAASEGAESAASTGDDVSPAVGWRRFTGRDARSKNGKNGKKRAPWWELPVLVIIAIGVAILVKTFLIQPFYIPSASMEKTLHGCQGCSGDRIIVSKVVYSIGRDPHPGDIVVFKLPDAWPPDPGEAPPTPSNNPVVKVFRGFGQLIGVVPPDEEDLVKRVIAVGGQTVKCCDASGNVQVSDNGPDGPYRSLDDSSYVYEQSAVGGQLPFGPVTVPAGRLWVMGDHRDESADSRYHCGGQPAPGAPVCADGSQTTATNATVPIGNVIGKAVIIAWPPSRWTTLGTPKTFESIPLPSAASQSLGLGGLAGVAPLGLGLVAAGGVRGLTGWRRRRRFRRGPRA